MARLFDDASSEYLEIDQAVVTAYPLTLAAWFYSDSTTIDQALVYVGDKDVGEEMQALRVSGAIGGDPIRAFSFRSGFSSDAQTTAGYSANTWHHACAVFSAATSRAAYLDGGNKGTDTGNVVIGATYDRTSIGRRGDSTPDAYMSGHIAGAAVWNAALSDDEAAILAKGYSPLFVKPENLVAYWPLVRGLNDRVGGYTLTASGTTVSAHPPVIYPAPPAFAMGAVAVAGQPISLRATTVPHMRQWQPGAFR